MRIDVRHNLPGLERALADGEKQVRFAAAVALTRTAKDVQDGIKAEMRKVFDRPTPWTLNATYLQRATRDALTATVGIKDGSQLAGKVTPEQTLRAQAAGGSRGQKRFERGLQALGVLPAGWVAVPSKSVPKDGHGNVSGQYLRSLLRAVAASGASGPQHAGRAVSRAKRQGGVYFVQRVGAKGLNPGIYLREIGARSPTPIMLFRPSVGYVSRLSLESVAQRVVAERFGPNMSDALAHAYATAR